MIYRNVGKSRENLTFIARRSAKIVDFVSKSVKEKYVSYKSFERVIKVYNIDNRL